MRFIIGQWIVIGILVGVVATIWERIVDPMKINLPLKLWLLVLLSWITAQVLLLLIYWICMTIINR